MGRGGSEGEDVRRRPTTPCPIKEDSLGDGTQALLFSPVFPSESHVHPGLKISECVHSNTV